MVTWAWYQPRELRVSRCCPYHSGRGVGDGGATARSEVGWSPPLRRRDIRPLQGLPQRSATKLIFDPGSQPCSGGELYLTYTCRSSILHRSMETSPDPITSYALTALEVLSNLVRQEIQQGQRLADLVGLVSDGTGPLAAMGRQVAILRREAAGPILDVWKMAMRSEEGSRELDEPGPLRLAVLVNRNGKGGMVFFYFDPSLQALTNGLELTTSIDNELMVRLIEAVMEQSPATVRDLACAAATVTQIAAPTWARLHFSEESFTELAGQCFDQMKAVADGEVAQGRDPWQLAGLPPLPEGADGVPISVELKYDRGVWARVTDTLTEGPGLISDHNEVATLLMVAARLWVLCRFDRDSFSGVARQEYEHALEDLSALPPVSPGIGRGLEKSLS